MVRPRNLCQAEAAYWRAVSSASTRWNNCIAISVLPFQRKLTATPS